MATPIAPTVSSTVTGPLGVMHLPRLWQKLLLHACGRLPDGYRHGSGGFDEFILTTLGLDVDAFVAFVERERPGYLAVEEYVRAHATQLNDETIATIRNRVENADLPEHMRDERFARIGLRDTTYTKAHALNNLDDWTLFHETLQSEPPLTTISAPSCGSSSTTSA